MIITFLFSLAQVINHRLTDHVLFRFSYGVLKPLKSIKIRKFRTQFDTLNIIN